MALMSEFKYDIESDMFTCYFLLCVKKIVLIKKQSEI